MRKIIGVDVGGTFTDAVSLHDGKIGIAKVATVVGETYRSVLSAAEVLDVTNAGVFNHASTHGLNAVITRRIPKVGFLTTSGHHDMLDVGRLWRPWEHITDVSWRRSFGDTQAPLVPRYLRRGIVERMTANGEELIPIDEAQAREQIEVLRRCGVQAIAICLLNSYVDGTHERRLRELVMELLGPVPCSISSEVSPLAKEYARASTTVVDVCMKVIYGEYTDRLGSGLKQLGFDGELNYADSAAMLVESQYAMARPYQVTFAGPAAGTASCAHFGKLIGDNNLLCVDVGGTSTDLSVVTEGRPYVNTTFELEHDLVVNSLSTDIATLGAGGGSKIQISPIGEILVGPDSAGANPGPACYGMGGESPTMTDAAMMLGILDPKLFLGGKIPLYPELSRKAFENLPINLDFGERVRQSWLIGLNNIVEGIFNIALKHGVDPRGYSLMAYGAAGPMMLPSMIDMTRVKRVIVPPYPGLFSALGLLSTDLVYAESRSAYIILSAENAEKINQMFEQLERDLISRLDFDPDATRISRSFDGRLHGQSWETPFVPIPDGPITAESISKLISSFHDAYEQRNGKRFEAFPVQAVTFRVQLDVDVDKVTYQRLPSRSGAPLKPVRESIIHYLYGDGTKVLEYERSDLLADDHIPGPAIVREEMSTTFVPSGHSLKVGQFGELVIE